MDSWLRDLRVAFRKLRRQPGFTATVVLTLTLGIGTSTSLFCLLDAVVLRPLPYFQPDRLALLWEVFPDSGFVQITSGEINLPVWEEEFETLESVSHFKLFFRNITQPGAPRRIRSWDVSTDLFETLGVPAQSGRTFQDDDARPGAEPVAILSGNLWRSDFGADPELIGRSIWLDGVAYRVVGILPDKTSFPPPLRILGGTHELAGELFVPAVVDPDSVDPRRNLALIARLAPGRTWAQAQQEVERRAARVAETYPAYNPAGLSATLVPIHSQAISDLKPVLTLVSIAVGLLLVIACINVANLLLAQGLSRQRDISIRTALGASRGRIIRELMTENMILAALGGMTGSLVAYGSLKLQLVMTASRIPQIAALEFSGRVLLFCLGITLLAAISFGLLPALKLSKPNRGSGFLSNRQESSSIRPALRAALVISEVALATHLLLLAGLMIESLWRIQNVDLGFDPAGVMSFTIVPSKNRYPEARQQAQLFRELQESVARSGAVTAAGAVSGLPLSGDREGIPVEIEGRPTATLEERLAAITALRLITPGYFETLGISLLGGRDIRAGDSEDAPPVVIVDRSFLNRFLPQTEGVGFRITFDDDQDPDPVWREIVGVVEDVRQESLERKPQFVGTVYLPHAQMAQTPMTLVVRSNSSREVAVQEALRGIREVDGELAADVAPVQELVDEAIRAYRSPTILLATLAAAALILAIVGLSGVISFIVNGRTREIGVRMALGATTGRIFRLVVAQTSGWTIFGIMVGSLLTLGEAQVLSGLLTEVSAVGPATYVAVAFLFLAVSLLATGLPALRASRVDPSTVLRDK